MVTAGADCKGISRLLTTRKRFLFLSPFLNDTLIHCNNALSDNFLDFFFFFFALGKEKNNSVFPQAMDLQKAPRNIKDNITGMKFTKFQ